MSVAEVMGERRGIGKLLGLEGDLKGPKIWAGGIECDPPELPSKR
jgi:hypothetical protein